MSNKIVIWSGSDFIVKPVTDVVQNESYITTASTTGNNTITLPHSPLGDVTVYVNDVLQHKTDDYSVNGTDVTIYNLNSGDTIYISYIYDKLITQ